jgi:hypothetical protein
MMQTLSKLFTVKYLNSMNSLDFEKGCQVSNSALKNKRDEEIELFINEYKHRLRPEHISVIRNQQLFFKNIALVSLEVSAYSGCTALFMANNGGNGVRCSFEINF